MALFSSNPWVFSTEGAVWDDICIRVTVDHIIVYWVHRYVVAFVAVDVHVLIFCSFLKKALSDRVIRSMSGIGVDTDFCFYGICSIK